VAEKYALIVWKTL